MKTVDKAMSVLDQFSLSRTEIGLSEMARLAGLDKAATRRLLVAMGEHGFIEQSAETKKYRLGHGFLRLARIREVTVPISQAAQEATNWLVTQTNETAHASIPGQHGMITIAHRLPNRGHVIKIDPTEMLYYHATASGLAFLSAASKATTAVLLDLKRDKMTEHTLINKSEIVKLTKQFRAQGYALVRSSFELDVSSIAMPIFDGGVDPAGAIALALPQAELTDARRDTLLPLLKEAVARVEKALTGL